MAVLTHLLFPENIFHFHLWMTVPFVTFSLLSILNAFFWAPLDAGEALFTATVPYGSRRFESDIFHRADPLADAA